VGEWVLDRLRYPEDGGIVSVERLVLASGRRTVVFGPNGAGKTTLLRLLAGTLPGGPRLAATYLPQRPYFFRGSARRNLHLGLSEDERRRAEELAGTFGAAGLLDRDAGSLSGGERQRVALARVLAKDADVVLLDEPLAPLDLRDRGEAAVAISAAVGERAAVIVSHDHETLAALGEEVAVMIDGEIRQVGAAGEVLSDPVDDVVAAVVGVGNVVPGEVELRRPPMVRVRCGPVLLRAVGDQEPGTAVNVLFGAETVSLHVDPLGESTLRNTLAGTITAIREVGRLREVAVDCGVPVVALVTPGACDALDLAVGTSVVVAFKATAARAVAVAR